MNIKGLTDMVEPLSVEEFLAQKRDFSPLLVHLTKDDFDYAGEFLISAKYTLEMILDEEVLKTFNHFCYFSVALNAESSSDVQNKFKVVCFTETPIDQIEVLLNKVSGRNFKPEPYGLVFEKAYIREKGGNPVLYITKEIARPLFKYLYNSQVQGKEHAPDEICKLLALVNVCERGNDWHWEREWRIVGNLEFDLEHIYCGLCPENDISYFENKYPLVKFISPSWGINKILDKLVER